MLRAGGCYDTAVFIESCRSHIDAAAQRQGYYCSATNSLREICLLFRESRLLKRIVGALCSALGGSGAVGRLKTYRVLPSVADSAVTQFDAASYIVFNPKTTTAEPLVVFLPGTGGKPKNTRDLLRTIATQGYRALALKYNDTPSVERACSNDPDTGSAEAFRRMRIYGDGSSRHVNNPPAESIVGRLVSLLRMLERGHPDEFWGAYIEQNAPRWERIVISGFSQGAGMAAYIAKTNVVRRVVLFSGPWDVAGSKRSPAPWLSMPSLTPSDRWFAGYHTREKTAIAIEKAYAALGVPSDHIEKFDLALPDDHPNAKRDNPYHLASIRDRRYRRQWRKLFVRPTG
jgi:dienelactone hydrolase